MLGASVQDYCPTLTTLSPSYVDIVVDNCAICRNHIMDLCKMFLQYPTVKLLSIDTSISVPDPKPTPARIAFSIVCVILEVIYVPDEVWGRD